METVREPAGTGPCCWGFQSPGLQARQPDSVMVPPVMSPREANPFLLEKEIFVLRCHFCSY